MIIRLKSIHANVVNESEVIDGSKISALIKVGYSYNKDKKLEIDYHISLIQHNKNVFVVKINYLVEESVNQNNEKDMLDKAVSQLEKRIELILGMLCDEIGIDLLSWLLFSQLSNKLIK